MKAYAIEQSGGPEVLGLRDIPTVAATAGEVRIRVRAFGLNRAEVYLRSGRLGPINGPRVPGIEAVGEVIDDPSGTLRTGQRVATAMGGMQFTRNGSYAEEVTVLRSNVIDLSRTSLSWESLAALPESYLTVWGALDRLIVNGVVSTLLVRGATASVGLAAVAYAKARGMNVIATTRSSSNGQRLREIGADEVIVDDGEIASKVRSVAPDGVDLALEVVGAATLRDTVKALKPFGTVVAIGFLGGPPVLEKLHLMQDLPNATRLTFFPSGLLGTSSLPLASAPLEWVAGEIAAGRMPSLGVQTFDFDDVRRAHTVMESGRALGKLVVRI